MMTADEIKSQTTPNKQEAKLTDMEQMTHDPHIGVVEQTAGMEEPMARMSSIRWGEVEEEEPRRATSIVDRSS